MTETDWATVGFLFGVIVFAVMLISYLMSDDFDGGW